MNNNYLEIYREGFFYNAYEKDALILSSLFKYKPYYKIPNTVGTGFPVKGLQSVCDLLESKNISYVVYSSRQLITNKEFKSPNNTYANYIELVNNMLQTLGMTYETYVRKLREKYLNDSAAKKEQPTKVTNNADKNETETQITVQVNDICEILFDDEIEPTLIKICQAVPVYTPTWTGNHDQNSRNTSNVEYKSDADFSKGEISSESPLAKAIIGKPVRTRFHYKVNDNIVSGIILKTYK